MYYRCIDGTSVWRVSGTSALRSAHPVAVSRLTRLSGSVLAWVGLDSGVSGSVLAWVTDYGSITESQGFDPLWCR